MNEHIYEHPGKAYVKVDCIFYPDGRWPEPTRIWWEDGREFVIDRIHEIKQAASLKAGGIGIRYTCRKGEHQKYIWYDDANRRWFVERRGKGD